MSDTPPQWQFDFLCDWYQFRHPSWYNWITFHFFHMELDLENLLGRNYTFTCMVLGFGFRISWYGKEFAEGIDNLVDKVEKFEENEASI